MNRGIQNINDILDDMRHFSYHRGVHIKSVEIDSTHLHITGEISLLSNNSDMITFLNDMMTSVICNQEYMGPQYVTNHMIKEALLDREKDMIEINIIFNRRFEPNDYK